MAEFLDPNYPRLWITEIVDKTYKDPELQRFFIGPHEIKEKAYGWGSMSSETRTQQVHQLRIPCMYESRLQMVLNPPVVVEYKDLSEEQLHKILDLRQAARDQKNFLVSDAIREVLKICGVLVEDSPEGQKYRRT